jgi:hypothetical protein
MNRFVIAVILGMLLATTMAFKMRATSKVQQTEWEGSGNGVSRSVVLGQDFPLTRSDRPMGHTMYTDAEFYAGCDPTNSKFTSYHY